MQSNKPEDNCARLLNFIIECPLFAYRELPDICGGCVIVLFFLLTKLIISVRFYLNTMSVYTTKSM